MKIFLWLVVLIAMTGTSYSSFLNRNQSSGSFLVTPEATVGALEFVSASTATLPAVGGLTFADCTVPTAPSIVEEPTSQVSVLSRWPSGCAKLVQFVVRSAFSNGVPKQFTISNTPAAQGANLTPADIVAAAPTASVQFSSCLIEGVTDCSDTMSLASLDLSAPKKIWSQGPEMIEAEYEDTSGTVWGRFFVRHFADGRTHIRIKTENGRYPTQTKLSSFEWAYTPTVTIGGVTVWNNGGSVYYQREWTGWDVEGWIGGDPAVAYRPDMAQFVSSGMVPEYWKSNPSETTLNAMTQSYTPGQYAPWTANATSGGFHNEIGPQTMWDSLVVLSDGDPRALASMRAASRAWMSYPFHYNDESTGEPVLPSARPLAVANGIGVGGSESASTLDQSGTVTLTIDQAHHGLVGYLAYLIDTHPSDYRTLRDMAGTFCWMFRETGGVTRLMGGQDRAVNWCLRTQGAFAGIARDDDAVGQELKDNLAYRITHFADVSRDPDINDLGYYYNYNCGYTATLPYCGIASWQNEFGVIALGMMDQFGALDDETDLHDLMSFAFKIVLGRLGPGGADSFCYNMAPIYAVAVSDVVVNGDVTTFFKDGATTAAKQSYDASCTTQPEQGCETPLTACSNTLLGVSAGSPADPTSRWHQTLAALSAALIYPGTRTEALVALGRLKAATNWYLFDDITADSAMWFIGPAADFN